MQDEFDLEQALAQARLFLGQQELAQTAINLILVLALGQVLAWHYVRFSKVLSNRRKFARLFVFVAATTMLVISVVKTSLALSLGLVGALSIIRFRTPIKEPEELAYLFLAVALGIGLGSDKRMLTVFVFLTILAVIAFQGRRGATAVTPRTLIQVNAPLDSSSGERSGSMLRSLLAKVETLARSVDVRRVGSHQGEFDANLVLDLEDASKITEIIDSIHEVVPGASVSVIEASSLE